MNLSSFLRFYAVLLLLTSAYSFADYDAALHTDNTDIVIIQASAADNSEFSDESPDVILTSLCFCLSKSNPSILSIVNNISFLTAPYFDSHPRAPPLL